MAGSAALLALGVTVAVEPAIIVVLSRRLVDHPNARSSHVVPTPRGGGVAVALGALAGLAVAFGEIGTARIALIIAGVGFAVLGLADDVLALPALSRLGMQLMVALAALPWLVDGLAGSVVWRTVFVLGVVLWLVAFVNAFNFMDGINGISAAQAIVAGVTWCIVGRWQDVPLLDVGGLIVAAAAAGFIPFNFPVARVFLGDVGSYFLGAFLAVLAIVGLRAGVAPEAVLAPLGVYLADTASTIVRRVLRGERWYEAHRDHAYQRLVRHGLSHVEATALTATAMIVAGGLGLVSLVTSPAFRALADFGVVGTLVAYLVSPHLVDRARVTTLVA